MKSNTRIETLVAQLKANIDSDTRDRLYQHIQDTWQLHTPAKPYSSSASWWKACFANKGKLALTLVIILILVTTIPWLDHSMTPAYGLHQTECAVEDILYFHFWLKSGPEPRIDREAWVEYDPNGELKQVRVNFYSSEQVMVWSENITQYWRQKSNEFLVFEDQAYTDRILNFAYRHDPKQAIGYLRALQHKGDVTIDYLPPQEANAPITFSAVYEPNTYLIGIPQPVMKEIYTIDAFDKLISSIEVFHYRENQFHNSGLWEYIDYDQPPDPAVFNLDHEVPEDCIRCNTVGLNLGLERQSLSDKDISLKVAQAFLEAWKNKDYERAMQMSGYNNPESKQMVLDTIQKRNLHEIISVRTPTTPESSKRGLVVPCTLRLEDSDGIQSKKCYLHVREFAPDRWCVVSYNIKFETIP